MKCERDIVDKSDTQSKTKATRSGKSDGPQATLLQRSIYGKDDDVPFSITRQR